MPRIDGGVGKSHRTPFKHWVLNAELGRLLGIFSRPEASEKVHVKADPFVIVDLCAGDAEGDHRKCSPKNIVYHASIAIRSKQRVNVQAYFIEKNPKTFSLMDAAIPSADWIHKIHCDAKEWTPPQMHSKQAAFIHSDPNTVADWPITESFLSSLPETATMLCTLGCNVGGLKRRPWEERQQWKGHMNAVVDHMPQYHDAILIILENDPSQWAYLLRLPSKWSNSTIRTILRNGRQYSEYSLRVASYKQSRSDFMDMQSVLFTTKKERSE